MFESYSKRKLVAILAITISNCGLLLVDHIHFQYNGLFLGVYLLSIVAIRENAIILSAFFYCLVLNMKHMFLYVGPLYFVFMLANYCFATHMRSFWTWEEFIISLNNQQYYIKWTHFVSLAAIVCVVFAASVGPFIAFGQVCSKNFHCHNFKPNK